MNDNDYREHCMALLDSFRQDMQQRTRDLPDDDGLRQWVAAISAEDL